MRLAGSSEACAAQHLFATRFVADLRPTETNLFLGLTARRPRLGNLVRLPLNWRARSDGWRARASIPFSWLQKNYGFSKSTCLNACFILNSPDQIFVSAGNLGDGNPDYHRPKQFPPLDPITLA